MPPMDIYLFDFSRKFRLSRAAFGGGETVREKIRKCPPPSSDGHFRMDLLFRSKAYITFGVTPIILSACVICWSAVSGPSA